MRMERCHPSKAMEPPLFVQTSCMVQGVFPLYKILDAVGSLKKSQIPGVTLYGLKSGSTK